MQHSFPLTTHTGRLPDTPDANFPTLRRPEYRPLSAHNLPPLPELEEWAKDVGLTVGELADTPERRRLAIGAFWNWRDIHLDSAALPISDLIEYKLTMSPDAVPHATPYRKHLSPDDAAFFRKTCEDGLMNNMYERPAPGEPFTRWDAPPVVVLKDKTNPDSERRLTFNYGNVKKFEILPSVHVQSLETVRQVLSHPARPFKGRGDFKSAYWSMAVAKESRHILSFFCPGLGQLRPTRAPQGCGGSGLILAEAVNRLFGPIPPPHAEASLFSDSFDAYQDDSFFAHGTFEDHIAFVNDRYLPRIRWSRFSVSFKKFEICTPVIHALGVRHEFDRIHVKPGRLDALVNWKQPETRHEVMQWLGAVNFCTHWIKNAEGLLRPIRDLLNVPDRNRGLKSKRDFVWGEKAALAFQEVKDTLALATPLDGLVPELPVHMYVDASDEHGGLVILQPRDPALSVQQLRPTHQFYRLIRFDSFSFTATERNYSTFKRELKVIIYALTKYNHLLNRVLTATIFTDHRPLLAFPAAVNLHQGIYSRWATILNEANVVLVYIAGEKNDIADGLSRSLFPTVSLQGPTMARDNLTRDLSKVDDALHPAPPSSPAQPPTATPGTVRLARAGTSPFASDPEYSDIFAYLTVNAIPEHTRNDPQALRRFKYSAAKFQLGSDGSLLRRISATFLAECVLSLDIPAVLSRAHDQFGHWNHHTVVEILRKENLWWPHMVEDAEEFVLTCLECFKFAPRLPPDVLQRSLPSAPFALVGLDFIDLPATPSGHRHILHLIDYFTRYSQTWATQTASSDDVIRCLTESFAHFPLPHVLYHDGGTHFTSGPTQAFLRDLGIHCVQAPVGHSQAAGMVERGNAVLQKVLRKFNNESADWARHLSGTTRALNLRVVSPHGFTPYELLFGYRPALLPPSTAASRHSQSLCFPSHPDTEDQTHLHHMLRRDEDIHNAALVMQEAYPGATNPRRVLGVGDLVWLYTDPPTAAKTAPRWRGPFLVVETVGTRSYRIAHIWSEKPVPGRFDIHHLRLFHKRPERLGGAAPLTASKTLRNPPLARLRQGTRQS